MNAPTNNAQNLDLAHSFKRMLRERRRRLRGLRRSPAQNAAFETLEGRAMFSATFTVTNTLDAGPGSLRQAILDANATANVGGTPDLINFNVPGAGVHTIAPTSELPSLLDPVTIDGYSQPGSSPNTLAAGTNANLTIELSGSGTKSGSGLVILGGHTTVRGLVINHWQSDAIITIPSTGDTDNVIAGNFLGTTPDGNTAASNDTGIQLDGLGGTVVGGTEVADRNLISGNGSDGISVSEDDARIINNLIGTNAAGTATLGIANSANGIVIHDGPGIEARGNVISGNGEDGVLISSDASNTRVSSNLIGTDVTGTVALGNGREGVAIIDIATATVVDHNVISGNGNNGILAAGLGSNLVANLIGTDKAATNPLGNAGAGVRIIGTANNVGSTDATLANVIAFNKKPGVNVVGGEGNGILRNRIFANGGLAIDLNDDGVTPNDAGDADSGPNGLQNTPVIDSVLPGAGITFVNGHLNSTPNTTFRIEFFDAGDVAPGASGEGLQFRTAIERTTDAGGNLNFSASFSGALAAGQLVAATATEVVSLSTSEFSPAVAASAPAGGEVRGVVFDDVNGNGTRDDGEQPLAGVRVFADLDGDGQSTGSDPTTASNADGSYAIPFDHDGTLAIRAVAPDGSVVIGSNPRQVNLTGGGTSEGNDFAVFETVSVSGATFNDANRNGLRDNGEAAVGGVFVFDDVDSDGQFGPGPDHGTVSDANGHYTLTGLFGAIHIRATAPAGLAQRTTPVDITPTSGVGRVSADVGFAAPVSTPTPTPTPTPPTVAPAISVNDASVTEGNSGTKSLTFTAKLSAKSSKPVTVKFTTADDTAVPGSDYVAKFGTLTFAAGQTSKTISVTVKGDTTVEPDERFKVLLSQPTNATIADGTGVGTIKNDDVPPPVVKPKITLNNVLTLEGKTGTRLMTFTVKLDKASTAPVTVKFATASDSAKTSDNDYVARSGTLTFAPGQTSRTIDIVINGDSKKEFDEHLFVNLTNAVNATISDAQGKGEIKNDD